MIPFLHGALGVADGPAFELIETQTVGAGGAATITFSSISGTYKHLQIRGIARTTLTTQPDIMIITCNSDSGTNYANHLLVGDGATAGIDKDTSATRMNFHRIASDYNTSSVFSGITIDILDYTSTSKYKTLRGLIGFDANGSGRICFNSGVWMSTSAITSITLGSGYSFSYKQHTSLSLYGAK